VCVVIERGKTGKLYSRFSKKQFFVCPYILEFFLRFPVLSVKVCRACVCGTRNTTWAWRLGHAEDIFPKWARRQEKFLTYDCSMYLVLHVIVRSWDNEKKIPENSSSFIQSQPWWSKVKDVVRKWRFLWIVLNILCSLVHSMAIRHPSWKDSNTQWIRWHQIEEEEEASVKWRWQASKDISIYVSV
jgi:hypothetical protein